MKIKEIIVVFSLITACFACKNQNKQQVTIDTSKKQKVVKTAIDSTETAGVKGILQPEKRNNIQLEVLNEEALNKIYIPLKRNDSTLYLSAEMKSDHRIFGFAKADASSEKLILFSIFTNEVEGNPFNCKYGSYYDISKGAQKFSLKYNGKKENFIAAILTDSLNQKHDIYFEKKWIDIK